MLKFGNISFVLVGQEQSIKCYLVFSKLLGVSMINIFYSLAKVSF